LKNNRFVFFKAVKIVKKFLPAFVSSKPLHAASYKLQANNERFTHKSQCNRRLETGNW
jgi:hypothetical protein